jgi:hypothetical protein
MKELEKQLSTILEKALNVAEKSGDFVIEQAPLLLQEFYKWHTASHIMGACLFVIPLILFIYFYRKADWDYLDSLNEILSVVFGVLSLCFIITSVINIYQLVFIITAPKLYLIEYFVK